MSKTVPIIIGSVAFAVAAIVLYKTVISPSENMEDKLCPMVPLQEDFDLDRFAQTAWFPLLRKDDMPFGPYDCQQHNFDTSVDPPTISFDWYYPNSGDFVSSAYPLYCEEDPARCRRGRFTSKTISFVATDYENFYMLQTCKDDYRAFYIGASQPLQIGTDEYAAWYAQMEEKLSETYPEMAITDLWPSEQSSECEYAHTNDD